MSAERSKDDGAPAGARSAYPSSLCERCLHVKRITSAKGSVFLLCTRAAEDPHYSKYPPQPVVRCAGFES